MDGLERLKHYCKSKSNHHLNTCRHVSHDVQPAKLQASDVTTGGHADAKGISQRQIMFLPARR